MAETGGGRLDECFRLRGRVDIMAREHSRVGLVSARWEQVFPVSTCTSGKMISETLARKPCHKRLKQHKPPAPEPRQK